MTWIKMPVNLPLIRSFSVLIALFFLSVPPAHAAVEWSLSVIEGFYSPALTELNRSLRRPEVEIGPRKTDARPAAYPVLYQGTKVKGSNEPPSLVMPEMSPMAPKFGIQIQSDINPRFSIVFGESVGVLESQARDIRRFFVGFPIDSTRVTRFSLNLNQVWLGVRRNIEFGKPGSERKRYRFYGEIGLLGVTDATLNTNVWLHVYAPEEGFDFYKVTYSRSEGKGYATYLGSGAEYQLNKWLSVGVDAQYVVGAIKDMRFTRFFTVDPLEEGLIRPGDVVMVTDLRRGSRIPLSLSLDGWDLKGLLKVRF